MKYINAFLISHLLTSSFHITKFNIGLLAFTSSPFFMYISASSYGLAFSVISTKSEFSSSQLSVKMPFIISGFEFTSSINIHHIYQLNISDSG
ncbi:hypothetical protein HOF65_05645 [bacterium]|nr:hypothetical protein [bacterium]MBT3853423.1 hypothetical protein [bacterium]MBT4633199.1 hypothetical protein [bacterium]MBT5490901.1 hypothetical protein [bacterium]MBT6778469.1 hypothetical protein [bacterium]